MAVCTNRVFFVDWRYPSPLAPFLEPRWISWNGSGGTRAAHRTASGEDDDLWSHSAMDDYQDRYLLEPDTMPVAPDTIEIRTNVWTGTIHQSACMQKYMSKFDGDRRDANTAGPINMTSQDYFRAGFEALFRWSRSVEKHTRRVRDRLGVTSPTVAIHLRTGLGETFRDLVLPTAEEDAWPLYYRCAKRLQRSLERKCNLSEDAVPLYLAADTPAAQRHFRAYRDSSVRMVDDVAVYHIDRTRAADLPNASESELQVWTDAQLLVESSCLVYTDKSKFSRLGQWLHGLPGRQPRGPPIQGPRCAFPVHECRKQDVEPVLNALDAESVCYASN
jgi:hypothetical protein